MVAGWHAEAEAGFRAALVADPLHHEAQAGLAAAQFAQGRLGDARRAWLRSLALRLRQRLPGILRWNAGQPGTPVVPGREVVDRHLEDAAACSRAGRLDDAAASMEAALRYDPGSATVLAAISGAFHPWNDVQAEAFARRALEIDPELGSAHTNLAAALWGQGRLDEAGRHCREAIRLNPGQSVNRFNLALILRHAGRLAEAEAVYRSLGPAEREDPRYFTELGNLLVEAGSDFEEARRCFRRAQALSQDPRPLLFEAVLDLLQGNFADGWDRYEARKLTSDQRWHRAYAQYPEWNGEPLGEAGLLVYGEQSLGDQIMFASMLPDVLARASRLTVLCDPRLQPLFARSFPAISVVADPAEGREPRVAGLRGIERQAGSGSLGRLFRRRADDFPPLASYLRPDPGAVHAWVERLAELGPGLKVGLSWRGGTQGTGLRRRSIPPGALAQVLAQPGVCWISLQHGASEEELAAVAAQGSPSITSFPGVTGDLDALAALCGALDLVITVCNTNVHVCGAIGREVWVLAPLVPEWRYGAAGERMPWYPAARVLRQRIHGDWSGVLQEAGRRLSDRVLARNQGA